MGHSAPPRQILTKVCFGRLEGHRRLLLLFRVSETVAIALTVGPGSEAAVSESSMPDPRRVDRPMGIWAARLPPRGPRLASERSDQQAYSRPAESPDPAFDRDGRAAGVSTGDAALLKAR